MQFLCYSPIFGSTVNYIQLDRADLKSAVSRWRIKTYDEFQILHVQSCFTVFYSSGYALALGLKAAEQALRLVRDRDEADVTSQLRERNRMRSQKTMDCCSEQNGRETFPDSHYYFPRSAKSLKFRLMVSLKFPRVHYYRWRKIGLCNDLARSNCTTVGTGRRSQCRGLLPCMAQL